MYVLIVYSSIQYTYVYLTKNILCIDRTGIEVHSWASFLYNGSRVLYLGRPIYNGNNYNLYFSVALKSDRYIQGEDLKIFP